ncbi:MAG: hypothetical protein COA96_16955 [SAR86 cluster bacterium]|uniref:Uncharacterized protein n=1 Tax=SAR86 cluster bacterium TaxID=2030880 RepID=A0A2A5AHR4_9GAMM|nr:MAG: hypothetical protein COA96_16955 [SAR86 cluster bacterium]
MDVFSKLVKFVDHERGAVIGLLLAAFIGVCMVACESTTNGGSLTGGEDVNRQQLIQIVAQRDASYNKRIGQRNAMQAQVDQITNEINIDIEADNTVLPGMFDELDSKDEQKAQVLTFGVDLGLNAISGNPINMVEAVGGLVTLLGIGGTMGFGADSIRKRMLINRRGLGAEPKDDPSAIPPVMRGPLT